MSDKRRYRMRRRSAAANNSSNSNPYGVCAADICHVTRSLRISPGSIDTAPPASARAESSIEAEIAIATLRGVTSVVRPASASPQSRGSLFRIASDGSRAERVAVEYGRTAGGRIEVIRGLRSGDRVIAADMSAFDGVQTLRLR